MLGPIKKIGWLGLISGLLCGAAAWLLVQIPIVGGLEEWLQDGSFFARGPRATQTKVILIGLDEASLQELPAPLVDVSPQLAEVVAYLSDKKAAALGIDLLIPKDLFGREDLQEGGKGDATKLGAAVAKAGSVDVVLAEMKVAQSWLQPLPQWRLREFLDPDPRRIDLGFVNVTEDDDNVLRRQQLGADGHTHFALALYARARQAEVVWGNAGLSVGGRSVPLDRHGKLRVNFVGPEGTFAPIAFRDVLAAARNLRTAPVDFADAIVIIGVTARSQGDLHATPYSNNYWRNSSSPTGGMMPGPELHANIIATIGDGAYVQAAAWLSSLPMLLVVGAGLGIAFERLNRVRRNVPFFLTGVAFLFILLFTWNQLSSQAFRRANLRIEVLPMFFASFLAYVGNFGVRWLALQRILWWAKATEADLRELEQGLPDFADNPAAVFISYASQDRPAVRALCDALGQAGLTVWFDQNNLDGGDVWWRKIEKGINTCACFVAVLSHTTRNRLEGVYRKEWNCALKRAPGLKADWKFIIPVTIDDSVAHDEFHDYHIEKVPDGVPADKLIRGIQETVQRFQASKR